MQLQTQRLIDRWVGQLLCAALSVWARFFRAHPSAAKTPDQVRHVLVIMLSEMGSVVLAGPMFTRIRANYPNAQLHLLQLQKNQTVATLLQLAPAENLHALNDASGADLLRSMWQVTQTLRRLPIDVVIDCELFSRISSLLALASGAPQMAGFTPHTQEGLYRGSYITHAIPYNPYRHISQQFVALVDAMQSSAMPRSKSSQLDALPTESGLSVDLSQQELAAYRTQLLGDHAAVAQHPLVLLYAGGGILPERAWPAAYYAKVASGLCAAGHAVGLIGLPGDKTLAQSIQNQVGHAHCIDLTGYTKNLRELLMLLHQAQLLITNDGGPGHFASLTPVRVMMFFGPETSRLYGPLSPRATVLESGIACSPCLSAYNHRETFCDGDNQCLKCIAPDPVLHAALAHLSVPAAVAVA
jgi:ADP-heptose:LPS heptosyltransferase